MWLVVTLVFALHDFLYNIHSSTICCNRYLFYAFLCTLDVRGGEEKVKRSAEGTAGVYWKEDTGGCLGHLVAEAAELRAAHGQPAGAQRSR